MKRITQFILCLALAVSGYGQGVGGNSVPRTVSGISNALDLISSTQGTVFYRGATGWEALTPGTSGQLLSTQGAAANPIWVTATGGAGDMNGPASATDNAIVRFDGTGGKTVQNSAVTIADTTGAMTWAAGQHASFTAGSSGASLVLGQGAVSGAVTLTPTGTGPVKIGKAAGQIWLPNYSTVTGYNSLGVSRTANYGDLLLGRNLVGDISGATDNYITPTTNGAAGYSGIEQVFGGSTRFFNAAGATTAGATVTPALTMTLTATNNVLVGTTTDMSGVTGGAKIASTSASTGVGTGALQVAGGIYAGAASVFGSTLSAAGVSTTVQAQLLSGAALNLQNASGDAQANILNIGGAGASIIDFRTASTSRLTIGATGAATFAGAVTVNNALANFGNGTAGVEVRASGDGTATPYGYWWRSGTTYEASMQQVSTTGVLTLDVGRNSVWGGKFDITVDTTRSVRFAKNLTTFDQPATFAGAVTTSSATLSGAGAIPITTSLVKFTSTGGAQALTLANGTDGQRLTIVHDVDGGSGVLTPTTKTGFSTITFTNAGDTVSLVYVTTRGWMVTGSYGVTIAP